jgi:uncharacterized membrane protein required for colicin V production
VNIGEILGSINRFDLLVVLFLMGMFVLGFAQGTIRRLLGIGAMLFSFLLACALRDPLGGFLAANWRQFEPLYSVMVGFGTVFVAATIAFTIVIQGFYHHQPLFEKYNFVDEVLGGILGVIQGLFLIGAMIVILDSFFRNPAAVQRPGELILLRELHNFLDQSATAELFRSRLIPGFFGVFGFFIPDSLRILFVPS